MFVYNGIREQLQKERRRNAQLFDALEKAKADMTYIAMMTDVELESEEGDNDGEE